MTVLQLGRVKELFDDLGLENIPVVEDVDDFCNQLLIHLSGCGKINELMDIITDTDTDWEKEDINVVLLEMENFFVDILPKLYPFLKRQKEELNNQQNGFLTTIQDEIKGKILQILSTGNIDTLKNEELEQKI